MMRHNPTGPVFLALLLALGERWIAAQKGG